MTPEITVAIISGAFLLLGGLVTFIATRGKTRSDAKSAMDARIDARVKEELDRVYKRIADMEKTVEEVQSTHTRKMSAVARILRQIAHQWVGDPGGPELDPNDIAEIESAMPFKWIKGNPTKKERSED